MISACILFLSSLSLANGLNLNGLGAKAVSMGGAFVGLADDYSAIFWNPAGIAQFKQTTFGFSGDDIIPSGTYKFDFMGMTFVNAKTVSKHYFTGMAAYYQPIGEKMVAGIGVYTPSGLGADWQGSDFSMITNGKTYEWMSKIAVVTISPALAYRISDQVSVGATFNINYGMFDIKTHAGTAEVQVAPNYYVEVDLGQQEVNLKGWGFGATFGILVKPSDMFSAGLTLRTASKVKFSGDASISNFPLLGVPKSSNVDGDVTWPMWIAGGIAFKPVANLTLTADAQYTNWEKIDVIELKFKDTLWAVLTAGEGDTMQMLMENKTQFRFGAEYKINSFALRAGYYFDPSPTPDKTMNVLIPNFDFNAFAVGFGYAFNGLRLDFALEYLKAKDRNIPLNLNPNVEQLSMPGLYTESIWSPGIALSYSW